MILGYLLNINHQFLMNIGYNSKSKFEVFLCFINYIFYLGNYKYTG